MLVRCTENLLLSVVGNFFVESLSLFDEVMTKLGSSLLGCDAHCPASCDSYLMSQFLATFTWKMFSLVVEWLACRTRDREVAGSTPGHCIVR